MRTIKIFIPLFSLLFAMTAMAQVSKPLENYAKSLQTRIIALEKSGEEYQSKLRYYQGLPKALENQRQKVRELEQAKVSGTVLKQQLQAQIDEEKQKLQEMTTELSRLGSLIKETNDKLSLTIGDLNKSRKEIDSLVNKNIGLRYMLDEAMIELSGIKQMNIGIRRKDDSFVYKVEQTDNKIKFVCPRDIGVFNCDLTHASFEVSFYDKENLGDNSYYLIFYKKDENGQYVYHTHLQIGFKESDSKYEDYRLYKSNMSGAIPLPEALPGGRDYVVGVMELKSGSSNLSKIMIPYAQAVNEKLFKATKTFVITP